MKKLLCHIFSPHMLIRAELFIFDGLNNSQQRCNRSGAFGRPDENRAPTSFATNSSLSEKGISEHLTSIARHEHHRPARAMLQHGLEELHGTEILLPHDKQSWPDPDALDQRYQLFRGAS
jgi:hypothetical protein